MSKINHHVQKLLFLPIISGYLTFNVPRCELLNLDARAPCKSCKDPENCGLVKIRKSTMTLPFLKNVDRKKAIRNAAFR